MIEPTTVLLDEPAKAAVFTTIDGRPWRPRSLARSVLRAAFLPIEIKEAKIGGSEEQNSRISEIHSKNRYLIRSMPMGLPLSKVGLTDCSARIALQTYFDNYLLSTFGGGINITPRECVALGIRNDPPGSSIEVPFRSLFEYFQQCRQFTEEKRSDVVRTLEIKTRIPFNKSKYCNIPGRGPKMFAYNGDDNIRILQSWAAKQANINAELRGQKVEQSKTMSSRRYIAYCQNRGRNPISQMLNIVLENFSRLGLDDVWKYETGPENRTYITFPRIRNKLLSQGSKGEEENAETVTTGRGFQLQLDSRYLNGKEKLKLHLLYRVAFPQTYQKVSEEEALPGVLGGLSVPDARSPQTIWDGLHENHRKLIEAATSEVPVTSYMALREINRSRKSQSQTTEESIARKTEKGRAAVTLWNAGVKDDKDSSLSIKLYTFNEAHDKAIDHLETKSQKDFSLYRRLGGDESPSEVSPNSIYSKDVRQILNQMFVSVDTLDLDLEARSLILKALEGAEVEKIKPDPRKDFEQCRSRIRRSRLAAILPPSKSSPPPGNPVEWLYQVGAGKEVRIYITRTDYMRLKPQTALSTRVLPGTLGGRFEGRLADQLSEFQNSRTGRSYFLAERTIPRMSPPLLTDQLEDPLEEVYAKRLARVRLESLASYRSLGSAISAFHLPKIEETDEPTGVPGAKAPEAHAD